MLVRVLVTVLAMTVASPRLWAIDDSESLNLLVRTLDANQDVDVRRSLLRGMLAGLEGRGQIPAPAHWSPLSEKLARSDDARVRSLAMQLSQIFGDQAAIERTLTLLKDPSADINLRRAALKSLLDQKNRDAAKLLESLLNEPALRIEAIRGFSIIANPQAPAILLERFSQWGPEPRRAILETLASRKNYASALLTSLEQGLVSSEEIPVPVARALVDLLGPRGEQVLGKVRPLAQDRKRLIAKYKRMITPNAIATADPAGGRRVFEKTCAACHQLYGSGGKVGPDLTGSNRANLDYILLNMVDPSDDVPHAYRVVTILTVDGRVVNGVLAEEDDIKVVLKTAEQPKIVIAKEDIESRKRSSQSMMPDGLLDPLKPQELFDLITYLRTTEQVEIAK